MQVGKSPVGGSRTTNPKLLGVITLVTVAILAIPVIIPHINHTGLIYHIVLHIASVVIAVFLTTISVIAYRRDGGTRLFFMMGGFAILAFVEFLYLFYSTINIEAIIIPIVDIEVSHVILLVMLTMFGIGVLKVNK